MSDTYTRPRDVFISWTRADARIKDDIQRRLSESGVTVLESDMHCYGNFVDWSRAAATSATVFIAIITENSLSSEGMDWELKEIYKKLENPTTREWWSSHIIPVCITERFYKESDICAVFRKYEISAVLMDKSKDLLEEVCAQALESIVSGFYTEYRRNVREEYIKISALYSDFEDDSDINFDFTKLYVPRKITCDNGVSENSPRAMMQLGQVSFLRGAAGSGKSRYINQIYAAAENNEVVIALKCADAAKSDESLFTLMYRRFHSVCGQRAFLTSDDFGKMLSEKKLILVLDGVDEVTTGASTALLAQKAEEYFRLNSTDTALIFTGRSERDLNQLIIGDYKIKKYLLEPLDDDDIHTLGTNLFVLMGDQSKGEAFYVSLSALDSEIRSNPMLLSQLAAIYNKTGTLPRTVAGILEAVLKITLNLEETKLMSDILPLYREMVESDINDILNRFAYKKYVTLSEGENYTFTELLEEVLGEKYDDDDAALTKRTRFLSGYLQKRAIVTEGEFSHKMFLEYFTAVYCFNSSFRSRNLRKPEAVSELFAHYSDPYWEAVIKLYLAKADSVIKADAAHQLFSLITTFGIKEYTLLFDACCELVNHKECAQTVLAGDILTKSADGTYPPYGPLFWYIPEYGLYTSLMQSLAQLEANAPAAALVRDVCVLNGRFSAQELMGESTQSIFDGVKLSLNGVRYGLCELFYTGKTDRTDESDVYPRLFSIRETKSWMDRGCGVLCHMTHPFEDELGLYRHSMYNTLNDEYIGIACDIYNSKEISRILSSKPCNKLCGLFLSDGDDTEISYIPFNRSELRHIILPENTTRLHRDYSLHAVLMADAACNKDGIVYFYDRVYIENTDEIPDGMFADRINLEQVYIGGGVRTIGKSAFEICVGLQNVVLPEGLESIGDKAFFGCDELSEIVFPQSLKSIGDWAFFNCSSLTVLNLPDKITEIPDGAFSNCRRIMTVNLPPMLTAIHAHAFNKCEGITFLSLPNTLKALGGSAFMGCKRLMKISIPDGVTLIPSQLFASCEALVGVELPDSVTKISAEAFENCCRLKSIKLPDSISEIGLMAFSDCTSLERIELPDGIDTINRATFAGCDSLREVKLPRSLKTVKSRAFYSCESLTSLDFAQGLTDIHPCAFENCISLSYVNLPDTLECVGMDFFAKESRVFAGCVSLKELTVPDSVLLMGKDTFVNCENLTSLILPRNFRGEEAFLGIPEGTQVKFNLIDVEERELIIPDGTTEIAPDAYRDDLSIVSVKIPEGVTKIGDNAFGGCENLAAITLPQSLTHIGKMAFGSCLSLKSIVLPRGVTEIASAAFDTCNALENVEIQGEIISVGANAFTGCKSLKSINLPDSLIEVGDYAFEDCVSLAELKLPYGVERMGEAAFSGCSALKEIIIPTAVTAIPEHAFFACESLSRAILHDGVKSIGKNAFSSCRSLTQIKLPDALEEIGEKAFAKCNTLREAVLPPLIKALGTSVFEDCTRLKYVCLGDSTESVGNYAFGGCFSLEEIHLPQCLTRIGASAFEGCESLEHISLPRGLSYIDRNAFSGCASLREITVPSGVEVLGGKLIDDRDADYDYGGVFEGCESLEYAKLECPLTELENRLFNNCRSLRQIILPDTVESIKFAAFSGCASLETISLPKGIKHLADCTFADCVSLKEFDLPEGVSYVGNHLFEGCTSLVRIGLHSGIGDIGRFAFRNCRSLKQLTLGAELRNIGKGAFKGCNGLEKIFLSANFKELVPVIFGDIDTKIIEYI